MGFAPMMLLGAGLSAAGQISAGNAADQVGQVNEYNQNQMALQTESQTSANVAAHLWSFEKFRGGLRADIAAQGGSAKRGTGLLLAQEAERAAKLDELNIIVDGANTADAQRAGAAMSRYEGKATKKSALLGGLGSAVNGFSDYMKAMA